MDLFKYYDKYGKYYYCVPTFKVKTIAHKRTVKAQENLYQWSCEA